LSLLKVARREPTTIEDLFRGGHYLLTTLLASLFFWAVASLPAVLVYGLANRLGSEFPALTTLLGAIPVLAASGASDPILDGFLRILINGIPDQELVTVIASAVGAGLVTVVTLIVLARLGQYPYLVLDQGAGVVDSLRGSWRLTRGRLPTLLL